jgi:hypothetical protein
MTESLSDAQGVIYRISRSTVSYLYEAQKIAVVEGGEVYHNVGQSATTT